MKRHKSSNWMAQTQGTVRAGIAVMLMFFPSRHALGQQPVGGQHWVGTWFASSMARIDPTPAPVQAPPASPVAQTPLVIPPAVLAVAPNQELKVGGQSMLHFRNQTLRQIAHVTLGGRRVRIVLSNTFGTAALNIGAAQAALRDKDASIVPRSNRVLTFGGATNAAVPAGAILVSDPVDLNVPDLSDLAIDLYLPDDTAAMKSPLTTHAAAWQTGYVSSPGNHAGVTAMSVQTTTAYRRGDGLPTATWFFLTRVEIMAAANTGAIVAIGDSITDGTASTMDTNNRWPDHLARRLVNGGVRMAVLNAGIGGNRVLNEGNGPSALQRFDRDVIAQPGLTHVIVFEGINDIGQARQNASPSAADLIAAHKQMIERAHARGLKIYGGTLTPFEGSSAWTPAGEAKRQALNEWIRISKAYDAFVDFDAAVRDPSHPTRTLAQYDPGDHLHLNPAGYQALADVIDLHLFRTR
ncbi:MAG: SGNH/GDSL hydrolase family protein [Vicinamibacteria bacterium]